MKTNRTKTTEKGFTLVEMLVSISLFAIVITMSVGTLLVLIDANGRAQSMQLVMTNLSFALDSMTREIRTGTNWFCGSSADAPTIPTDDSIDADATSNCAAGGNYISISESGSSLTDPYGTNRVTFWFDDDFHGSGIGALLRKLGGPTGSHSGWIPLTSPEIDLEEVRFVVSGTDRWSGSGGDTEQPIGTVYIKGRTGFETGDDSPAVKEFSLQTSIVQRTLDI